MSEDDRQIPEKKPEGGSEDSGKKKPDNSVSDSGAQGAQEEPVRNDTTDKEQAKVAGALSPEEESSHTNATHNVPREATDPFSLDGMPLALLEFHSPTQGLVNLPATASAQYIVWVTGSLLLACLAAMTFFPVNKVVTVTGRLITDEPTVLVQPFESGIVRSIDAHIGDYVQKGQALAHLDASITQADLDNLVAQMQSVQAEVARLKAEAVGEIYHPDMNIAASVQQGEAFLRRRNDYNASLQDFDQRIASMETDLQGLRANKAMLENKMRIVSAVLSMRRQEQKEQVGSRLSTLGAQDALMDAERSLVQVQKEANSTVSKLAALKATRESYIQKWKATVYGELTGAERHLDEVTSSYRKARIHQRLIVLRAPQDGIVLTLGRASLGSVLEAGNPLMTLVPAGSALEMEGVMPAQDGGYVKQGDHAIVKFTTFPYDVYGGAEATVRLISADTFMPQEAAASNIRAGIDPQEFAGKTGVIVFYRIRLRIDHYTLHGVPPFFHPAPGVPVKADIDVGKRTIMKYLFSRVVPAVSDGMREPS